MYQKTLWTPHEIISTARMNNIEQGIYQNSIGGNSIPVVTLTGDTSALSTGGKSTLTFYYNDGTQEINGYAKTKWQGDTSSRYPKKNYKITLYSDEAKKSEYDIQPKKSWLPCNTFNLKANWIDSLQSRNLMNAELVREMALDRNYYYSHVDVANPTRPSTVDLSNYYKTQSFGQMQGFFVEVYINGEDKGLYTFNTNKNAVSFNMDPTNQKHIAIENNNTNPTPAGLLNVDSDPIDGTVFDTVTPSKVTTDVKTAFNTFLSFVNSSSDADFASGAYNKIDINSAIDNIIISNVLNIEDTSDKSLIYLTYDGLYWIPIVYDLDSGEGMNWDGGLIEDYTVANPVVTNHLHERILNAFHDRVVSRYQYLRKTILSADHVLELFSNNINSISTSYFNNDETIWPNIPSAKTNTFEFLQYFVINRMKYMDTQIK